MGAPAPTETSCTYLAEVVARAPYAANPGFKTNPPSVDV